MIQREAENQWQATTGAVLEPYSNMLRHMNTVDSEILTFADRFHDRFSWLDKMDGLFQAKLQTRSNAAYQDAAREIVGSDQNFSQTEILIIGLSDEATIAKASSHYQEAVRGLVDLVFNGDKQSEFRSFVLEHFDEVTDALSPFSPFGRNPSFERYNPSRTYQRLATLFDSPGEEDRDFLARYVGYTKHCEFEYAAVPLDKDILNGHLTRAKAFTQFNDRIRQQRNRFEMDEYDAMDDIVQEFLRTDQIFGRSPWRDISETELLAAVDLITNIKIVVDLLPEHTGEMFFQNRLETIYRDRQTVQALGFLLTEAGIPSEVISHLKLVAKTSDDEVIQPIPRFSQALDSILATSERVFSLYLLQYFTGRIDAQDLSRVSKVVETLTEGLINQEGEALYNLFGSTLKTLGAQLEFVLSSPEYLEQIPQVLELLRKRILPTRKILDFMREYDDKALEELIDLRSKTSQGEFDPDNDLQKELEFSTYFRLTQGIGLHYRRTFESLKYVQDTESPRLESYERREAEAETYEIANGYWFIRGLVDSGKIVDVIRNPDIGYRRSASDRFIKLLQWDLEMLGINILRATKGSQYFRQRDPDHLVMVDVTANPYPFTPMRDLPEGMEPRLHSELLPYLYWIREIANDNPDQQVGVYYWTPEKSTREIHFAGEVIKPLDCNALPNKAIILMNPTIRDSRFSFANVNLTHSPGYLNNLVNIADRTSGSMEFSFTPHGLKNKPDRHITPQEFNGLVEACMEAMLPQALELTDPKKQLK